MSEYMSITRTHLRLYQVTPPPPPPGMEDAELIIAPEKGPLTISRFCEINCAVILRFDTLWRYVLSVTFCGAVVMKVMDQKTLVKRR